MELAITLKGPTKTLLSADNGPVVVPGTRSKLTPSPRPTLTDDETEAIMRGFEEEAAAQQDFLNELPPDALAAAIADAVLADGDPRLAPAVDRAGEVDRLRDFFSAADVTGWRPLNPEGCETIGRFSTCKVIFDTTQSETGVLVELHLEQDLGSAFGWATIP